MRKLPLLLMAACLLDEPRGPELGACAEAPDGVYTFGEVGIGTCLAGPSDVRFVNAQGTDWILVANADPYHSFTSGSLLAIDVASVLDHPAGARLTMDQLTAHALPTSAFIGEIGVDGERVLLADRNSPDAVDPRTTDHISVIDISDPTEMFEADRQETHADPFAIEIDPTRSRAWVTSLTERTVQAFSLSGEVSLIDLSPHARFVPGEFTDSHAASTAAVAQGSIVDDSRARTEPWNLTRVDGSWRIWLPDDEGDLGQYAGSGFDLIPELSANDLEPFPEIGVDEITDPHAIVDPGTAIPVVHYASGGSIYRLVGEGAPLDWTYDPLPMLSGSTGWDRILGGPAYVAAPDGNWLYFDGRATATGNAAVGRARFDADGSLVRDARPAIEAPAGFVSLEDPFPMADATTGTLRVWVTLFDGARYSIGHVEDLDGDGSLLDEDVSAVLSLPDGDIGAPAITWANGRYHLHASRRIASRWTYVHATSPDGLRWDTPAPIAEAPLVTSTAPPRPAATVSAIGHWRVRGENTGTQATALNEGATWISASSGFSVRVASGYALGPEVVGTDAALGLTPGAWLAETATTPERLYVTTTDTAGRANLAVLEREAGLWTVSARDLIPPGDGGNLAGASDPVVWGEPGAYTMAYSAARTDGTSTLHLATSDDGLVWTPEDAPITGPVGEWDNSAQRAHAVQALPDGGFRLWYAGSDGSRFRIGALVSDDGVAFAADPEGVDGMLFEPGESGEFDDAGVRDPFVVVEGDTEHLFYAGFDGSTWQIGRASRDTGGAFVRRVRPIDGRSGPVLQGIPGSFSTLGATHPLLRATPQGLEGLYAGLDGAIPRIGGAQGTLDRLFPLLRTADSGDQLTFHVRAGGDGGADVQLSQVIQGFDSLPSGDPTKTSDDDPIATVFDPVRGFLYVFPRIGGYFWVVDVRDDSATGFDDLNVDDVEAIVLLDSVNSAFGLREGVLAPDGRLFVAAGRPDEVLALDLSAITDDATKELVRLSALGTLPMRDADSDAGPATGTVIGPIGLDLSPDGRTLVVSHWRDDSVWVYDIGRGAPGTLLRRIPRATQNPNTVRISPDGRFAVVAGFVGDAVEGLPNSELLIVDLQPDSPTYLQIRNVVGNR